MHEFRDILDLSGPIGIHDQTLNNSLIAEEKISPDDIQISQITFETPKYESMTKFLRFSLLVSG